MLDDHNRHILGFPDVIDEGNRMFAGRGIKVCERLVKKKYFYIVDENPAERNALFLSARELGRRVAEKVLHIDNVRDAVHLTEHFILRDRVIFKSEREILCYGKADELPVRVLQNSSDNLRHAKDARLFGIKAAYPEGPLRFPRERTWNQCVYTVRERRFSAARRAGDQDFFTGINLQIDIGECRLFLRAVSERIVAELDDWFQSVRLSVERLH